MPPGSPAMEEALKKAAAVRRSLQYSSVASPSRGEHEEGRHSLKPSSPGPAVRTGNMGQQFSWHLDEMKIIKVRQKQFAHKFIEMEEKIEIQNKTINIYRQERKARTTGNMWPQVDNIIEQMFHILEDKFNFFEIGKQNGMLIKRLEGTDQKLTMNSFNV